MRFLYAVIVVLFLIVPGPVSAKTADLEYTFQRRDSSTLYIIVSFTGDKTGTMLFHLPNEWAGQTKLYNAVSQLKALSGKTTIDSTAKRDEYTLKYTPGRRIKLGYVLSRDWTGPVRYPQYFRPVILRNYFFIEGYSGIAYPDMDDRQAITCRITYKGFAHGDFLGNSFFSNDSTKSFKTTLSQLRNSMFCAGNFRAKVIKSGNQKIVTAITGKYAFDDEAMSNSISGIIVNERKFWRDEGAPYYFTVLMDMIGKANYGGTAHYNSFYMFVDTGTKLTEGPLELISHEYFHNWLGQGLTVPQPSELYYWFSEGFTDYYSLKILYTSGIISRNDFVTKLNKKFKEYYLSPVFNFDNQQLVGRFWENNDLKDLSYRRGLTIAFVLDNQIGEHQKGSLDDLLREMYHANKPPVFSQQLFDKLVNQYADMVTFNAINEAGKGQNEELTKLLMQSPGYTFKPVVIDKVFGWGFDISATRKDKKITGLKPGSNAEKAGLAENMEITNRFSFWNNDPEKPAKVEVLRDGKKEWITFMPAETTDIRVPQIVLN